MKQRSDIFDRLPPELHDRIIDHLHRDRRTLSACSLVCKAWQSSSRYHLFQNAATVRVTRDNIHRFDEPLVTGRITPYVGRLSILLDTYRFHDSDSEDLEVQQLLKFSDHLCHLTGLAALKYLRLAGHELRPLTFIRNFASITDLQLNRVSFDSFAQFQELIQCCSLLRRLALIAVDYNLENPEGKSIYLPPGGLQDLVVHVVYAVPIFNWLCSRPIILRKFALGSLRDDGSEYISRVSRFLRAVGSSLQSLIIYNTVEGLPFDLSQNVSLRTVKITGIIIRPDNSVAWVPEFLSQIHSLVIETVTFNFITLLDPREGLERMDWPEIRRLLAGPHFASLREVEFSLSGHVEWSTGFIQEKLGERSYALRIVPRDRPFFYGLHVFDT